MTDEIRELENKRLEIKAASEREVEVLKSEISALKEEKRKLSEQYGPDIKEINEQKELLKKKEEDLRVIEERYKKLYADKGAGFKIT